MEPIGSSRRGDAPVEGQLIEARRNALGLRLEDVARLTLFSRPYIRVLETGRASGGRHPTPQAATYARVALALGMTAQQWREAARHSRRVQQITRLREIAQQMDLRKAPHPEQITDVAQVTAMLSFVRSLCPAEVFSAAVQRCYLEKGGARG